MASKRKRVAEVNKRSHKGKTIIFPRTQLPVEDIIKK